MQHIIDPHDQLDDDSGLFWLRKCFTNLIFCFPLNLSVFKCALWNTEEQITQGTIPSQRNGWVLWHHWERGDVGRCMMYMPSAEGQGGTRNQNLQSDILEILRHWKPLKTTRKSEVLNISKLIIGCSLVQLNIARGGKERGDREQRNVLRLALAQNRPVMCTKTDKQGLCRPPRLPSAGSLCGSICQLYALLVWRWASQYLLPRQSEHFQT